MGFSSRRALVTIALLTAACSGTAADGDDGGDDDGGPAECGNGVLEAGELCDGAALNGETCSGLGHAGGTLGCASDCRSFDTSACEDEPACGDGKLDPGELCDGAALNGQSCATQVGTGGTLACASDCHSFELSQCSAPATCGNGAIDGDETCDGTELDGATCASQGFVGGTLACASNCLGYDTTACDAACVPDCSGRECGPDPVCGQECGPCVAGDCGGSGQCIEEVETSVEIGPGGGTLELEGASFVFPAGAVTAPMEITCSVTADPAPTGYTLYSPVYRCEPAGLTFEVPIQVSLPFSTNTWRAAMFWSRPTGTTGYERLGGVIEAQRVTAEVDHFSTGFVADGVDYTDPPDPSCVVSRLVEGRQLEPSAVALLFTVDDCQGRPITGLTEPNFALLEDGSAVSSEAAVQALQRDGLTVFAELVLDLSSSTQASLQDLIDGAKSFVDELHVVRGLPVHIGIQLFAGDALLTEALPATLDTAALLATLDGLGTFTPNDPSSTNLYGAIIQSFDRLTAAEDAFAARNYGGALTSGYVVLFTDGRDTAGLSTLQQALDRRDDSPDQLLAVGLDSPDYDLPTLQILAEHGLITAPDATTLTREFSHLATRITGQMLRTYLVGYCSPKRGGNHTVEVEVAGATNEVVPLPAPCQPGAAPACFTFNADGFGPGCTESFFDTVCGGAQCGGLGCGACDDRLASCDPDTLQCLDNCSTAVACGSEVIVNPAGYDQVCADVPERTSCDSMCVDTTTDEQYCGDCFTACALTWACEASECVCPGVSEDCGGTCVDTDADVRNCGACGNVCAEGATCQTGTCVCPAGMTDCDDRCVPAGVDDFDHCGGCGGSCNPGEACVAGGCLPNELQSVSVGNNHSCGLRANGFIECWGVNTEGQTMAQEGTFDTISAGGYHTCGLRADGSIECWGLNLQGQLGPSGYSDYTAIAAGDHHTCGLRQDGTAVCWGYNAWGQASAPAGTFTALSCGAIHCCGLLADETIGCWGNSSDNRTTPPLGTFKSIAAGNAHSCAVRTDDTVACWGGNESGESTPPSGTFLSVDAGAGRSCGVRPNGDVECWGIADLTPPSGAFAAVSVGYLHACGMRPSGDIECWGNNDSNRATAPSSTVFTTISTGDGHACGVSASGNLECWGVGDPAPSGTFVDVAAGGTVPLGTFACGVKSDASVECWGDNDAGQGAPPSSTFERLTAGVEHTCGIRTDGSLECWGQDALQQTIAPVGIFAALGAGEQHTCALRPNGLVECWGRNSWGEASPPADAFLSIDAGQTHTCGVRLDGTATCWGYPSAEISSSFFALSTGRAHACGLRTDGTIECWGDDSDGQATPPPGEFSSISAGGDITCALRSRDRLVKCWGALVR